MSSFTESVAEDAALAWLRIWGHAVLDGPDIAAGELGSKCSAPNFRYVLLEGRLRQAFARLNPELSPAAVDESGRKLTRMDAPLACTAERPPVRSEIALSWRAS